MTDEKKILVVNCGSSSLKYEIYEMPSQKSLGKGLVERIGEEMGVITQKTEKGELTKETPIANHAIAFELTLAFLLDSEKGVVKNIDEISGVGHRTVHAGEKFASSVIITDEVIDALEENINLAPLHNPANLTGIFEAKKVLPNVKHVGVFDTAFHQTMPSYAYMYALPRELYNKYKVRRYGFHGTSHRFVTKKAYELMGVEAEGTGIISCHLGNGASIAAIQDGKSVDTSMGMTPLEGLIMGTRSGDVDPGVIFFLTHNGYSIEDVNTMLNKKSGMLGLSGISNDMRDIESAAQDGKQSAVEALDAYCYRISKYIGAYFAALDKVDAIIFTGGIGQHSEIVREKVCKRLENMGIVIDENLNKDLNHKEGNVAKENSNTKIFIIPTNEELQIALDTYELIYK